jgi:hypothetical protein
MVMSTNSNWIDNPNPKYKECLKGIPNLEKNPLHYVFEDLNYTQKTDTMWLEFGVWSGSTINYISKFTPNDIVYGFDSFDGLPEDWRENCGKGTFDMGGGFPSTNENVQLIKGWFTETVDNFIKEKNKPISFIHFDADLYSSTKYVMDCVKNYLDEDCIFVFDELVNYPGYDAGRGELRAWYEFINENEVDYEWIGMSGAVDMELPPDTMGKYEKVAVRIKSIKVK